MGTAPRRHRTHRHAYLSHPNCRQHTRLLATGDRTLRKPAPSTRFWVSAYQLFPHVAQPTSGSVSNLAAEALIKVRQLLLEQILAGAACIPFRCSCLPPSSQLHRDFFKLHPLGSRPPLSWRRNMPPILRRTSLAINPLNCCSWLHLRRAQDAYILEEGPDLVDTLLVESDPYTAPSAWWPDGWFSACDSRLIGVWIACFIRE